MLEMGAHQLTTAVRFPLREVLNRLSNIFREKSSETPMDFIGYKNNVEQAPKHVRDVATTRSPTKRSSGVVKKKNKKRLQSKV